jgi:hypothetical protein
MSDGDGVVRGYGHDETEDFEALAEAERRPDGSVVMRVVTIESTEQEPCAIHGCSRPRAVRGPVCIEHSIDRDTGLTQ